MSAIGTVSDCGLVVGARLRPAGRAKGAEPLVKLKTAGARLLTTMRTSKNSFSQLAFPGITSQKTLGQIQPVPSVFWLVIPGKASWLKEFFDVRIVVSNLAPAVFSFTNGSAPLALPAGLSLAPTTNPQSLTVPMADIAGQSSGAVDWVVRGDVAGEYQLSASYAAALPPFDQPVQLTAHTLNPLKVWGGNALEMFV